MDRCEIVFDSDGFCAELQRRLELTEFRSEENVKWIATRLIDEGKFIHIAAHGNDAGLDADIIE